MTRIFTSRDDEQWMPPRPAMPTLPPAPPPPPPPPKPMKPEVIVSAEPGTIHLDARDAGGKTELRATCTIETRQVELHADGGPVAFARWTGSSFADLTWTDARTPHLVKIARLIEEALVRAWGDPEVRRASYTHPAEAVLAGVRPSGPAPDGGKLGQELGELREHEALDLVRRAMVGFPWALRARRATPEEDRDGKDIVVETDQGELYVQVKASAANVQKWRRMHGERLGSRAFVVRWDGEKPPAINMIVSELRRAYRSTTPDRRQPAPSLPSAPTPRQDVAAIIAGLPAGVRGLFDAAGKPMHTLSATLLLRLSKVYELALAREREKTERVRISAEHSATSSKAHLALRRVLRELRLFDDPRASALIEAVGQIDPRFISDEFVMYESPVKKSEEP